MTNPDPLMAGVRNPADCTTCEGLGFGFIYDNRWMTHSELVKRWKPKWKTPPNPRARERHRPDAPVSFCSDCDAWPESGGDRTSDAAGGGALASPASP